MCWNWRRRTRLLLYRVISEDDMANLLLQGSLSTIGARHFKKLVVFMHHNSCCCVDEDMLRSVWTELDYRIDTCRVTKGSHTEHL